MTTTEFASLITIISGMLIIIGHFTGAFRYVWTKLKLLANPNYHSIPKKTIVLLPHLRDNWWHMGGMNNQPAMQIVGYCNVTNITDNNIELLNAEIIRPRKARCIGSVSILRRGSSIVVYGPIPPKAVAEVHYHFWIQPPICSKGSNFTATIALVDKFGNRHTLKNVRFKYT